MQLNLGEIYEKYIDEKIQSGQFNTADEVIKNALQRQIENERECARIKKIHELIASAEKQLDNSEGIPYTPDLMRKIGEKAIDNSYRGKAISDVIKP